LNEKKRNEKVDLPGWDNPPKNIRHIVIEKSDKRAKKE